MKKQILLKERIELKNKKKNNKQILKMNMINKKRYNK